MWTFLGALLCKGQICLLWTVPVSLMKNIACLAIQRIVSFKEKKRFILSFSGSFMTLLKKFICR